MVRVEINKKRHLTAFVITCLVFIIGMLIGYSTSSARINYLQNTGKEQRLEIDSLQLQSLYVRSLLEDENCPAITKTLENNIDTLEKTRARIESFIEDTDNKDDYRLLKREYTLEQLRYWFLARETKKTCEQDVITILYFYSDEEICADCRTQGAILTNLKDVFKNKVLIFALDANFNDEPMVPIITESFNVKKTPTTIVENQKFEGFTEQDILVNEICSGLKEKLGVCNG